MTARLEDLVKNQYTDKHTTHSYLNLYESLLAKKRDTATDVLEVGIGDFGPKNGGSILLWRDYFTSATVHALDILPIDCVLDELRTDSRVKLYTSMNAYDENVFKLNFLDKNIKCDFMLDDGPHTLDSMKQFIRLYSQIMKDDGILIIEDVQDWSWIEILTNEVSEELKPFVKVYDLRANKNRYDDIVFTIDKSINS
jgi:hypothetical protein